MFLTLSLTLLALLSVAVKERPGGPEVPPLEILDLTVNVHVVEPRNVTPVSRAPRPAESIPGREAIPGSGGGSRRDGRPTIAERSAELRRAPARGPSTPPAGGSSPGYRYEYLLRARNVGPKKIKYVLWEAQVFDADETLTQTPRLFRCALGVKPGGEKSLRVWTPLAPFNVVSAGGSAANSPKVRAVVKRVEYDDGSTWQRVGWQPPGSGPAGAKEAARRLNSGECVVW